MDWLNILSQACEICLFPVLSILSFWAIKLINTKAAEWVEKNKNDTFDKYILMLADTIEACVLATNQTYVEGLKKEGKFDLEAQKKAFEMTKDAVLAILTEDAKECLSSAIGDLDTFLAQQIEAQVNISK